MARNGVTYQAVENAALELIAAQKTPTIEAIRHLLGTGSHSTLSAHLKIWKQKGSERGGIAVKEGLPQELIASVKGVWTQLNREADKKIEIIEQNLSEKTLAFEESIKQISKEKQAVEEDYEKIEKIKNDLLERKSSLEAESHQLKMDLTVLSEKNKHFEDLLLEKEERLMDFSKQNQQMQANLEHYREASLAQRQEDLSRYEEQERQFSFKVQEMNQALALLHQEKLLLLNEKQALNFENHALKENNAQLHSENITFSTKLLDLEKELAKTLEELVQWKAHFSHLQDMQEKEKLAFLEAKTEIAILSKDLERALVTLKTEQDKNQALREEKEILGQEKAQLMGQVIQMERHLSRISDPLL